MRYKVLFFLGGREGGSVCISGYIFVLCSCSFFVILQSFHSSSDRRTPQSHIFWPVNLSYGGVPRDIKNYFRGSSMKESLGNNIL